MRSSPLRMAAMAMALGSLGGTVMSPAPPAPEPSFDPRAKGRPYKMRGNKRWHGEVLKKRAQRLARRAERRSRK